MGYMKYAIIAKNIVVLAKFLQFEKIFLDRINRIIY